MDIIQEQQVIEAYLNISVKSVKRWIKRYTSKGIDFVRDEGRSGRPSGLNLEQQEHLKNKM
jgi:transposase